MTPWDDILAAVGVALGGDPAQGRHDMRACWAGTAEIDQAQRCVLAHYLADLEEDLAAEVAWDEQALTAFANVQDADLAPVGIPAAAGLARACTSTSVTATSAKVAPRPPAISSPPDPPRSAHYPTAGTAQ